MLSELYHVIVFSLEVFEKSRMLNIQMLVVSHEVLKMAVHSIADLEWDTAL